MAPPRLGSRTAPLRQRASIALSCLSLIACSALVGCRDARDTNGPKSRRAGGVLSPDVRANSLADGVSASDSERFLSHLLSSSRTALRAVSSAQQLCGVDAATIPRGVILLPGATEDSFLTLRKSPVQDARDAGRPVCGPNITADPSSQPLLQSSFPGRGPQSAITITFSTPLSTVSAYSYGALTCVGGQYGNIVAYDATGSVIATANMRLREESDCGADQVTFGVHATVSDSLARIKRVVINPPQPWTFDVPSPSGTLTGYVTAAWILTFPVPSLPCPTGDSLLDNQAIRDFIKSRLADSRVDAPLGQRIERVGLVWKNIHDGGITFQVQEHATDDQCYSTTGYRHPSPDSVLLMTFHTHPYEVGDTIAHCDHHPEAPAPTTFDPYRYGGAGPLDFPAAKAEAAIFEKWGLPVPRIYVVDIHRVYRLDPATPQPQWVANPYVYEHDTASCHW